MGQWWRPMFRQSHVFSTGIVGSLLLKNEVILLGWISSFWVPFRRLYEWIERQVIQSYSNYTWDSWDNSGRVSRWLCLTPKGIVIPVLSKVVPNCLAKLVWNWLGLGLIMDISDISMVWWCLTRLSTNWNTLGGTANQFFDCYIYIYCESKWLSRFHVHMNLRWSGC